MPKRKGFLFQRKIAPEQSKGFTLVELLVTVTIIAILSAIGLVAYASVSRQGRDSKRRSDLLTIQSALEQYYSDQGFYPCATSGTTCAGTSSGLDSLLAVTSSFTNRNGNPNAVTGTKTYINTLPKDPTDTDGTKRYRYEAIYTANPATACDNNTASTTKCNGYCLYSVFENSNPGTGTCTLYPAPYNFALTPP